MTSDEKRLELDKILAFAAEYAATEEGKQRLLSAVPHTQKADAEYALALTEEAYLLLFELGAGRVNAFPPLCDKAERARKGAPLTCSELSEIAALLGASRGLYEAVGKRADERLRFMKELLSPIVPRKELEREITEKIVGENELADTASDRLFALRREKRLLGEKIRARLAQFLTGDERKYLQEELVTVRGDRFVVPVKAEYKRNVKGFVHDRSSTGATFFIEPEEIFEMNNELRMLALDEREEEARILKELSRAAGNVADELATDEDVLYEADVAFARAEYAHAIKAVKPVLNTKGVVSIVKGRHPLLDGKTAVPVTLSVGESCRFLVLSGSNTGGKTVTLKMCGLFCLMAACGLFVPAAEGTRLSVFGGVYCDTGDSQSIEENLSTFSSHISILKNILEKADGNSLVLIDEPGGGTDPEEGQALATAVLSALLRRGAVGVVTTHYGALKEFAFGEEGLQNGCMEFDAEDFHPLYRLKMGASGSSNALAVCRRLGFSDEILNEARGYLSEGARAYEKTLRVAEESRVRAEELEKELLALKEEWSVKLSALEREEEKFAKEKERFLLSSKAEARRIVNERTAEAEELLEKLKDIFNRPAVTEGDLIEARTLKNKIDKSAVEREELASRLLPVTFSSLRAGDRVAVGSMNAEGIVLSVKREKMQAQVQCGALRVTAGAADLFLPRTETEKKQVKKQGNVRVVQRLQERPVPVRECNLIGLTVSEALLELENFLDSAIVQNLAEVRVVHGMGTGKLRKAVHERLKNDKRVKEFRLGVYGEGESGVTIVRFL